MAGERKDDGGEAFPLPYFDQGIDLIGGHPGMSLRDWFAGQALALARDDYEAGIGEWQLKAWFGERGGLTRFEIIARCAQEYADAMLEARKK